MLNPKLLVAEWDTLNTFRDNTIHHKTKSVHFLGLMNSANKQDQPTVSGLTVDGQNPALPIIRNIP